MSDRVSYFLQGFVFSALIPAAPILIEYSMTGEIGQSGYFLALSIHLLLTGVTSLNLSLAIGFVVLSVVMSMFYVVSLQGVLSSAVVAISSVTLIFTLVSHFISRLVIHLVRGEKYFPW